MKKSKPSPPNMLPNSEQNRHLRAECEARMMEALLLETPDSLSDTVAESITESVTERLSELFVLFPDLKKEYEEMRVALGMLQSISTVPARKDEDWSALERRISARIGGNGEFGTLVATATAAAAPKRASIFALPLILRNIAAIAAIFVAGLFIGRWSLGETQREHTVSALTDSEAFELRSSWQHRSQERETADFLNDAHLLMLGVMAMNAECGTVNPQTLVAQRERCVALMAQAQELRQTLSPRERERLAHVIVQVEFALAELAGTQPSSFTASTIRKLQAHTDNALCEVSAVLATTRSQ